MNAPTMSASGLTLRHRSEALFQLLVVVSVLVKSTVMPDKISSLESDFLVSVRASVLEGRRRTLWHKLFSWQMDESAWTDWIVRRESMRLL